MTLQDSPSPKQELLTNQEKSTLPGLVRERLARAENFPVSSRARLLTFLLLLLLYATATAVWSMHQLWHDELYTYYVAKANSLAKLWEYLHYDLNPPLSYLAVHLSHRLLGDSEYATRLPFILAFLIGSICLYEFVSARIRPAYGILAVLVFWATPFFSYATEARPYAFLIGFFGLAMLAWERAILPHRKRIAVILLGLSVTAMMMSHFFALFYIAPFCLAEVIRTYRTRRIDWAIWAALLVPAVLLLGYMPLVSRFQATEFPLIFQASPRKLITFFFYTLYPGIGAIMLACGVGVALSYAIGDRTTSVPLRADAIQTGFILGLFSIPVVVIAVLMRSHGAFFPRYGAPTVLGYGMLAAYGVARLTGSRRIAAVGACIILCPYVVTVDIAQAWRGARDARSQNAATQSKRLENIRPDLPLVAASGLTFFEMDHYAAPDVIARLFYLTDRRLAKLYAHATIFEGFNNVKEVFPIRSHVEDYTSFTRQHTEFLVLGTKDYPEDWLLPRLLDIHAEVKLLAAVPGPYKDHELFEVVLPATP